MEKGLKELLESAVLNEETKHAFLEAWNHKLAEVKAEVRESVKAEIRESVEAEVREEFASRFANDKTELVEAMDRMLTDAVKEQATRTFEAEKALKEERARLTRTIKEARAEYKTRLANHVRTLETFVLDTLKKEISEVSVDHRALQAQRVKLVRETNLQKARFDAAINENVSALRGFVLRELTEHVGTVAAERKSLVRQQVANNKIMRENASKLRGFVLRELSEHVSNLAAAEKALKEQKLQSARTLREHRTSLNTQTAERINKLEAFVVEQLTKEIGGLETDRRQLAEAKVRLLAQSKQKMEETRVAFIKRASALVESTVESHLRKEMSTLKEDIRAAKENLFGRRLFEAFSTEFMSSYLSEGTKVKKLMGQLDAVNAKLAESNKKAETATKLVEAAERKAKTSEERAVRAKTLNDLLSPLGGKKREVMEGLLETVKTSNLKEAFQKYLPTVLNETAKGSSTQGRRTLVETPAPKRTVAVTGDRASTRLAESARADDARTQAVNAEIIELRRLAGIEK